jgi:hypothetical protein
MATRTRWQGMMTIVRFNWPFYAVSAVLLLASLLVGLVAASPAIRIVAVIVCLGAAYFFFVSLAVSHQVYDRSDLYRWHWVDRALGSTVVPEMILCHTGFDEASPVLRQHFQATHWTILDHFDEKKMTEPSIRRARRMFPPSADTQPARFDQWPVSDGMASVVFGLLAIHELRRESERIAWFLEAKRCLRDSGRIIIAEHLRDLPNAAAFGPGALHFHSARSWRKCWEAAGLRLVDKFRPTGWVVVFVLAGK